MTLVICPKHGAHGIIELCPHAADLVDKGCYNTFHTIEICTTLLVCEECLQKYDLGKFKDCSSILDDDYDDDLVDAYFEAYEQLEGRQIECRECVAAAEVKQARKNGEPDPFPVYERTLNSNHRDILDLLKAHLTSNFKFQHSVVEKQEPACFIYGGGYREPLTVKVYYVTAETEQNYIIGLVKNFLADFELNQGRILFYEKEVWVTWSNPEQGTSGGSRGDERLLQNSFINC